MSVNETVNQSQNATAGGSGDSPEKLVADHVEKSWEYITENGFDLLADVAVDTLVKNHAVPSDAFLHAVKTSWCLHRAAVHYARQYSVERVSADFARGDAQFEHSLRAQAERKAEKLEADLAQSVLLVESQRLRIEEARAEGAEWCEEINKLRGSLGARREELTASFTANQELRQKLETAEAALLEQQQRNEELVTQNSHQFTKIAGLQRQVEGAKTQELEDKTQELPEYTPPEGWRVVQVGEPLRGGDEYHEGLDRYIRPIEPQPEPVPEPVPQAESDAELRIRLLQQANDSQAETIGRLQAAIDERANLDTGDQTRAELQARIRELETIRDNQAATIEELRSEVSYVQRLLGESNRKVAQLEDLVGSLRTINEAQEKAFEAAGQHNSDLQSRLNAVCSEWSQQAETIRRLQIELAGAIQSRDLLAETNREQAGKIEHLQKQVEALTILGL